MFPFEFINNLIEYKKYKFYLEVGVRHCNTFNRVKCETKIGIDPAWEKEETDNIRKLASDDYFKNVSSTFDIIFIDGLHEKHQVMRDVYNALKILNQDGIILIHDCLPRKERDQGAYCGGSWTGNVWKAMVEVRKDPSIDSATADVDWGIGLVVVRPNSLVLDCPNDNLKWEDYVANKDKYLRVIQEADVINFLWRG